MKKLFLLLAGVGYSVLVFGQFEGTILWNCRMEISDPNVKTQIDNAKKAMNSPENQAAMKEMESKMNDPQFKAMMETSPEIKAMMEKQMASMKGGNAGGSMFDNMVPKNIEIKIKGINSLTKIVGGMVESEILSLGAEKKNYTLHRANKTYTVSDDAGKNDIDNSKISKTEEFANVMGYKCRKYIVESFVKGQKVDMFVWATTEIKDIDPKQFSKININGANGSFMEKMEGLPMKIQANLQGYGHMTMEVGSMKKEAFSTDVFEIPKGFVNANK